MFAIARRPLPPGFRMFIDRLQNRSEWSADVRPHPDWGKKSRGYWCAVV